MPCYVVYCTEMPSKVMKAIFKKFELCAVVCCSCRVK